MNITFNNTPKGQKAEKLFNKMMKENCTESGAIEILNMYGYKNQFSVNLKKSTNNERLAAQRVAEINTDIMAMIELIKDNLTPAVAGRVNYGHVGDAAHVKENLKEICEFMGIEIK